MSYPVGEDVRWIDDRRDKMGTSHFVVGELVPRGFPAYVRIMHPAQRSDGGVVEDVSWHETADANGRTLRALSHFEDLVPSMSASDLELARPLQGQLADRLCERLAASLCSHTATPSKCTFMFAGSWGSLLPSGEGVTTAQMSDGQYIMTHGNCLQVCTFEISPTIWWPSDRSWIVVSQVDLDSTFIGCELSALQALVKDPDIEAWQVSRTDPI